jgi:hypothetical protein
MFKARDWLAAQVPAAAGVTDQSWETVAGFALLWSLFEERLCGTEADKDELDNIASQYHAAALTEDMQAAYAYWHARYLTAVDAAARFDELFAWPQGRGDVHDILADANPTLQSQVFAQLMIVYRLRNNLFHGVKKIETFNDQRDNLLFASKVLAAIMEDFNIH